MHETIDRNQEYEISLRKATLEDAQSLHEMQVCAFRGLLEKYRDYSTNPAAEPLEKTKRRLEDSHTDYYFILLGETKIGAIRIWRAERSCRISPVYILPKYQGRGYAQKAISLAEQRYPEISRWNLDTIKEEEKLCYLYEKLGYRQTGEESKVQPGLTLTEYEKIIVKEKIHHEDL